MRRNDMQVRSPRGARGAIAILVGLSIVALLLMVGLVVDLSHLFIAKSELQNAADACSLSGAHELDDHSADLLVRATQAAKLAGSRNRADLQHAPVAIADAEITFADTLAGPFTRAVTQNTAYIRCAPQESNPISVVLSFMRVAGITDWKVSAESTARMVPPTSSCSIPLAMCTLTSGSDFVVGTWYTGKLPAGGATTGNYDWIRFAGQGAKDLADILTGDGFCGSPEHVDVQGGVSSGTASAAWNTRFGLYGGSLDPALARPDFTGYAFTPVQKDNKGIDIPGSGTWTKPAPQDAYPEFLNRRQAFAPYDVNSILDPNGKPSNLSGGAKPLTAAQHQAYGKSRRMVTVPVIRCHDWQPNGKDLEIVAWACALMISPIADTDQVSLEYRGPKGSADCGGAANTGTNPALVR
jgi:Flp pilus assembly protein TadG